AKALCEKPSIPRIATAQNLFNASPHGARSPCVADGVIVNLHIDAEVAFNSCNRVNGDSFCHKNLLLVARSVRSRLVFAEMSVLEIASPPDVRPSEPEIASHGMPLAERSRKNRKPLHGDQKPHTAQGNES